MKSAKNYRQVFTKTALAMLWEALYPAALPLLLALFTFLIFSWGGVWPLLYNSVRIIIVLILAGCILYGIARLGKIILPKKTEIIRRIQQASNLKHRPLETLSDKIDEGASSRAKILWRAHQKQMAGRVKNLSSALAKPKLAKIDPWAIRSIFVCLLFVAFMAKEKTTLEHINDAFIFHGEPAQAGRIDGWINQPLYTNRAPIFLKLDTEIIEVAENSELVLQATNFNNAKVFINETPATKNTEGEIISFAGQLKTTGIIKFSNDEKIIKEWHYKIIKDEKPAIEFVQSESAIKTNSQGWLELNYQMSDDYGIEEAHAKIELAEIKKGQRPLVEPIILPLAIVNNNEAKTVEDYLTHIFAGSKVTITLYAKDYAKQMAKSASRQFVLAQKPFIEPLAKSLVSQRQMLGKNANKQNKTFQTLDMISTTRPDIFITDITNYLALRVARHKIKNALSDSQLLEALELLWHTALVIENGDLSLAEQRLKDAQARLQQALENNADEQTIAELMNELREAMREFMQQLAKRQQNQQGKQQEFSRLPNENIRTLSQNDIERMMQQIEDLAKSGSKQAAQELLRQFQQMMSNLQFNQQRQAGQDPFSESINKLGELIEKQQQLLDETHKQQQELQQQSNRQQGEQSNELQQRQQELQNQIENLKQEFKDLGLDENKALGEAGKQMGEAGKNLGKSQMGRAKENQDTALNQMRQAARDFIEQMKQQGGEQTATGERGQHSQGSHDPLGRPTGKQSGWQTGDETKIPNEINTQRAREILNAIRKKLGEFNRPEIELEYLERLLPKQ